MYRRQQQPDDPAVLAGGIVAFVYIICLAHFLISIKIHNDNSEQDIVTKLKETMSTPCDDTFHFSDDETHLIEANELQDDENYHYIGAIITTKPENLRHSDAAKLRWCLKRNIS